MADFSISKSGVGAVYPDGVEETTFDDVEPLITPEKLVRQHLWGIPLVSAIKNPFTKKPDILTPDDLKAFILEAVALAETEIGGGNFDIFPKRRVVDMAFDKAEYDSFGYFQIRNRPVASIQELSVVPANGTPIFVVPLDWISTSYLHVGQLNIIPLSLAVMTGNAQIASGPMGPAFLALFGQQRWIAGFWRITATYGFSEGKIPKIVNQLVGVIAAMECLSMLATTYARQTSSSLSIDGLSESQSTPGPQLFNVRLEFLAGKRKFLIRKLQRMYALGLVIDNV